VAATPWNAATVGRARQRPEAALRSRLRAAGRNAALGATSLLGLFLAGELALGIVHGAHLRVLTPSNRLFTVSLDCYPTNPRGYFDVDLHGATTLERFKALRVRRVGDCAARAPYAVELRYNSLQFRDREPGPRRPGVRRVVVLGDSFTEGQGVKEPDVYPRVLERALDGQEPGAWEVLNFGHRGADFPALYDNFELVLGFEPDVVVYGMTLNDCEQAPAFRARYPELSARLTGRFRDGRTRSPSFGLRLVHFVQERIERSRLSRETTLWYRELYGEPNREGWARSQSQIREMHRRTQAKGGRLLVAVWPVLTDLTVDYPFREVHETVGRFCRREGISWLDLLPALEGHEASDLWVHPIDAHPNEIAHRLVADRLAPAVRRLGEGTDGRQRGQR
jgi:lysophospholipase L1-like esterase